MLEQSTVDQIVEAIVKAQEARGAAHPAAEAMRSVIDARIDRLVGGANLVKEAAELRAKIVEQAAASTLATYMGRISELEAELARLKAGEVFPK